MGVMGGVIIGLILLLSKSDNISIVFISSDSVDVLVSSGCINIIYTVLTEGGSDITYTLMTSTERVHSKIRMHTINEVLLGIPLKIGRNLHHLHAMCIEYFCKRKWGTCLVRRKSRESFEYTGNF